MERTDGKRDKRSRGKRRRGNRKSTGAHKMRGQPGHTSSAVGADATGRTDHVSPPLATVAALSGSLFAKLEVKDAVPRSWVDRATKAVEYYQEEPIVSNSINAWRVFALGDEITVGCEEEDIGKEAQQAFDSLLLNRFVKDMILQLLIKGDMIGYFNRNETGDDLARVTCVNPISVELIYEADLLAQAIQRPQRIDGSFGQPVSLALDQMIHKRWNAPEFEPRGNSMILPAFESIELLRDYRKAERAIAARWVSPLRLIQVGGNFGGKLITPSNDMIRDIRDELNRTDLKEGVVVPFYVKAETYGAEGKAIKTDGKIREAKEDILVALGMARSIVTGDGPNFATASVSMQKMVVQLKEIKQAARELLDWVFDEWKERKGYRGVELHYQFNDLDLYDEVDQKKLLIEMYDRGLVGKATVQTKMGLSPEVEGKEREDDGRQLNAPMTVDEIAQLVALEVITPDEAREKIGLAKRDGAEGSDVTHETVDQPDRPATPPVPEEQRDVDAIYARHALHG